MTSSEPPAAFFDVLARRRMVRSFRAEGVPDSLVTQVVQSAHRAPSAGNTRSLEMLVLRGVEVETYWETTLSADRREVFPWPGLLLAPVLLIPYVAPARYVERYNEPDKQRTGLGDGPSAWPVPYWWVDGGAAVENMLLASIALGLGACFFGQFEHEIAVRTTFGVPDTYRAVGTVAIGYPEPEADRPSESSRRPGRRLSDTTHWGRW